MIGKRPEEYKKLWQWIFFFFGQSKKKKIFFYFFLLFLCNKLIVVLLQYIKIKTNQILKFVWSCARCIYILCHDFLQPPCKNEIFPYVFRKEIEAQRIYAWVCAPIKCWMIDIGLSHWGVRSQVCLIPNTFVCYCCKTNEKWHVILFICVHLLFNLGYERYIRLAALIRSFF